MLLLMTVLVGVMNLINYSVVVKESDAVLDVISQPNIPFFDKGDPPEKPNGTGGNAIKTTTHPRSPTQRLVRRNE